MIICDRCKKQNSRENSYFTDAGEFDVCEPCLDMFNEGRAKIKDEQRAITEERLKNWKAEWLNNYKPK